MHFALFEDFQGSLQMDSVMASMRTKYEQNMSLLKLQTKLRFFQTIVYGHYEKYQRARKLQSPGPGTHSSYYRSTELAPSLNICPMKIATSYKVA